MDEAYQLARLMAMWTLEEQVKRDSFVVEHESDVSKMKKVQYWINNAGINGGRRALSEVPINTVEAVVKVNLLGILLSTKVAIDIMGQQVGFSIYGSI